MQLCLIGRHRSNRSSMRLLIYLFFIALPCLTFSQTYAPGNSYFGINDYIEYVAGNLPLIISVPHGGYLAPRGIPDRTCAACFNGMDTYTQELSVELKQAIHRRIGCYPHLIINKLERTKLDANREVREAAMEHPLAIQAWHDFHDYIQIAKDSVVQRYGKGLYIDLHSHAHPIGRIELGYLLIGSTLRLSDSLLNAANNIDSSSIRHLVYNNLTLLTHADLLRGKHSLGSMLYEKGFKAVPSQNDPFPKEGEPYFMGGYNTARHGAASGGTIDGVQFECNGSLLFSDSRRRELADTLASILLSYLQKHYFTESLAAYCNPNKDTSNLSECELAIIFPNPACNALTIQCKELQQIKVYNVIGQLLKILPVDVTNPTSIADLPKGWYNLVLIDKQGNLHSKPFLKQCE